MDNTDGWWSWVMKVDDDVDIDIDPAPTDDKHSL